MRKRQNHIFQARWRYSAFLAPGYGRPRTRIERAAWPVGERPLASPLPLPLSPLQRCRGVASPRAACAAHTHGDLLSTRGALVEGTAGFQPVRVVRTAAASLGSHREPRRDADSRSPVRGLRGLGLFAGVDPGLPFPAFGRVVRGSRGAKTQSGRAGSGRRVAVSRTSSGLAGTRVIVIASDWNAIHPTIGPVMA